MHRDIDHIIYITGNESLIDDIKYLWHKLNKHHIDKSLYFKEHFLQLNLESRIKKLLENTNDLFVIIAKDSSTAENVGYCISSQIDNNIGEIDSIYVLPEY
ncbi:MAG: GNAT family N-acetyltransferase [Clostridiales bacterium]|nr:GNAT family N-acetyltransferase [Clostridiales bacterium]